MPPRRKGERLALGGALLLLYGLSMREVGRGVLSRATAVLTAPLLLDPRASGGRRRLLRGRKPRRALAGYPGTPTIDDERGGGRNAFLDRFESVLATNATSATDASSANFAALVLNEGKVYCRQSHMKSMSRARYFVQMLRRGVKQYDLPKGYPSLPILIKHDDSSGCHPGQGDKYGFPRLTWSIPANATTHIRGSDGPPASEDPSQCWAVGMPSYKMWSSLRQRQRQTTQDDSETSISTRYPWRQKIRRAVWRGSTTANRALYGRLPPREVPRAQLVRSSLERPDLIDAGFHRLVGRYDGVTMKGMLKKAVPLEEMARYKAIIDIDGNGWSARFSTLLCTNSVVIKIAPDFTEYFYAELRPDVHYVPASLDNITEVVSYVMDETNDAEMRAVVARANEWCRESNTVEKLASRAVGAVKAYAESLDAYDRGWRERWEKQRKIWEGMEDWTECRV
ncbi:hypothetical protein ACHAXT_011606 [Thalassiosira profunda]